jgi:sRNA-binding protein
MPEHEVVGGAAAYTDAEGLDRIAFQGDVIDFTSEEADRLMEAGMLRDVEAEKAAAEAEEAKLQEQRDAEDQARADEAERIAGEEAAAKEAQEKAREPKAETRRESRSDKADQQKR